MAYGGAGLGVRHSTTGRLVTIAAALAAVAPAPAFAHPGDGPVTWTSRCHEAALYAPADYADIAPLVDARFRDDIVRAGGPDGEKALLVFSLNNCLDNTVLSPAGSESTGEATELIVAVALASSESDDLVQFYSFATYTDWPALAAGFGGIGLPTIHTPGLSYDLDLDPLTRAGTIDLTVPTPDETITIRGNVALANPFEGAATAGQFAVGPHGPIYVHHEAPRFALNPGAAAVVGTAGGAGPVTTALGGTSGEARGIFLDKGPGHSHSAALIDQGPGDDE